MSDKKPAVKMVVRVQSRHDLKFNINEMHQPGPCRQREHDGQLQFEVNTKQHEKRHKEMPENNDILAHIIPRPFFAQHVPIGFFRHVGVPNNEILGEIDVSPEHRERKKQSKRKPGERWLLVTSAYHMPRSVGLFRKAGFSIEPYPVDWRVGTGADVFDFAPYAPDGLGRTDTAARRNRSGFSPIG